MRTYSFLRRLIDVPMALCALVVLVVVWRMWAKQAEPERWPDAGVG